MFGNKIVIVDDDLDAAEKVRSILLKEGFWVKISNTESQGDIALWRPDLVLVNPKLSNTRDSEFSPQLQSLPTLSLSDTRCDQKGLRERVNGYFLKSESARERDVCRPGRLVAIPLVLTRHRSGAFCWVYRLTKRIFDITLALFLIPFALPIMAIIALVIRLDSPGPMLWGQQRTGWNGKVFKMYKFRTMLENAVELKEKYKHLNQLTWPDFKIDDDPRVTKVGKFLRRSSLDELPQLFNILMGSMSFVGPRPTSFAASTYKLWHTERLEILPGLTGLWQVSGRGDVDFDERVEMDIEYIDRQCWKLDLYILARTVTAVVWGKGAY